MLCQNVDPLLLSFTDPSKRFYLSLMLKFNFLPLQQEILQRSELIVATAAETPLTVQLLIVDALDVFCRL